MCWHGSRRPVLSPLVMQPQPAPLRWPPQKNAEQFTLAAVSHPEPDSSSESSTMHYSCINCWNLHSGCEEITEGEILQIAAFPFWSLAGFTVLAFLWKEREGLGTILLKMLFSFPSWFFVPSTTWPKNKRNLEIISSTPVRNLLTSSLYK